MHEKIINMKSKLPQKLRTSNTSISEYFPRIMKVLVQKKIISVSQLSNELGVNAEHLNPALRALRKEGFLQRGLHAANRNKDFIVSLYAEKNCILGIDLGGTKLFGAITDLAGNILYEKELYNHVTAGEACYEMLVDTIHSFLEIADTSGLNIRGIGVEVPGRVRLETGLVLRAPAIQWKEFPLKERLVFEFGLPVFVDNDLKQSALGESWFGAGKQGTNVALLAIGTGMAVGMVADDILQRGAHLRHGEIGWMVPSREFLGKHFDGFGPMEVEAAGPGIAERARILLSGKRSDDTLANLTCEDVFIAARAGEEWGKQVVAETVDYLAILIANIMAFYDPDVIILSGGISRSSDLLIDPILKLIEGCVLTQPNIVVSSLGYRAGVLGAIANLILNCPEFYKSK
jgi:glucokinase